MVLESQRDNIDPLLSKISSVFLNVNPDVFTWFSVVFAFLAGLFFYLSSPENEFYSYFLLLGSLFVFLNGLFDAMDGKIAKMTHKASLRGDFLDHALDRYADVFMVGGLALSPWCNRHPEIGLVAIIGMLLTSYMGTQSQAIGHKRDYSGLLGRADRLFLLMIAPIIQRILIYYDHEMVFGFFILEWVLIYFAVIGNLTAVQRFYSTLRWFKKKY